MAASLIQHGAIRTTEAKAKEVRRMAEKLITIARQGTLHARRRVVAELQDRLIANDEGEIEDKTIVQKLFDEIAPRYADRPGGYTRIIRLSERRIGDAGTQVILQLVEEDAGEKGEAGAPSRRRRRAKKRLEAGGEPEAATEEPSAESEETQADEEPAQDSEGEADEPAEGEPPAEPEDDKNE